MTEMLNAREMQDLLQVDRSTIYRMAEAGQLPAVKVGKQWRFPGDLVDNWLQNQTGVPSSTSQPTIPAPGNRDLASMLPLDCVQLIQDPFAEALGVTLVVTDLSGRPITEVSNPHPLYHLLHESTGIVTALAVIALVLHKNRIHRVALYQLRMKDLRITGGRWRSTSRSASAAETA